jgi:hypothetical protein
MHEVGQLLHMIFRKRKEAFLQLFPRPTPTKNQKKKENALIARTYILVYHDF